MNILKTFLYLVILMLFYYMAANFCKPMEAYGINNDPLKRQRSGEPVSNHFSDYSEESERQHRYNINAVRNADQILLNILRNLVTTSENRDSEVSKNRSPTTDGLVDDDIMRMALTSAEREILDTTIGDSRSSSHLLEDVRV